MTYIIGIKLISINNDTLCSYRLHGIICSTYYSNVNRHSS